MTELAHESTCGTKGAYEKLVHDSNRAEGGALGNKRGAQTQEQRNCKILNLVLKGKLREAVHFICERQTGAGGRFGKLLPDERVHYKSTVMDKTVAETLAGKIHTRKTPRCCVGSV